MSHEQQKMGTEEQSTIKQSETLLILCVRLMWLQPKQSGHCQALLQMSPRGYL